MSGMGTKGVDYIVCSRVLGSLGRYRGRLTEWSTGMEKK